MINIKELRKGNYVTVNQYGNITLFHKINDMHDFDPSLNPHINIGYTIGELSPIGIGPEVLKNCGFISGTEVGEQWLVHPKMKDIIYGKGAFFLNGVTKLEGINYLHQLQNFFYSKTGEQLEVKSPFAHK